MNNVRLIARLDVKAPNLIKGVHLEGLRKIGDPNVFAKKYYESGADEIVYMDAVASLYGRNSLFDIIERTTRDVRFMRYTRITPHVATRVRGADGAARRPYQLIRAPTVSFSSHGIRLSNRRSDRSAEPNQVRCRR